MANLCELHDLWIEDAEGLAKEMVVGDALNEVTQKCAKAGRVGIFSEMKVSEKVQGL